VGIPGDDVDSRVVHWSTLKSVFGEPIEHQALTEVTGDLRVPCALVYLHIIFPLNALRISGEGAAAQLAFVAWEYESPSSAARACLAAPD
jgi:hypothetical protein